MKGFYFYRRNLPHYRADGATYFVTWRIHPGTPTLTPNERSIVARAFQYFDGTRYRLHAWVVMDDHVHVVVRPSEKYPLEKVLHSWKSFTARQINISRHASGSMWQSEYMDRIIRNNADLLEKISYVIGNPSRRWPSVGDYQWVWHSVLVDVRAKGPQHDGPQALPTQEDDQGDEPD